MSRARIFISYRRSDSAGWAGRLHADLQRRFGREQVFRDVAIPPGVDFVQHIEHVLDAADITIAVIGPQWTTVTGPDGEPRLHDPGDLVRIEVQRALDRPDVQVVPVLVDGARMPTTAQLPPGLAELTRRNAYELTDRRWDYDVKALCRQLRHQTNLLRRRVLAGAGMLVVLAVVGVGAAALIDEDGSNPPETTTGPTTTDDAGPIENPPRVTAKRIGRVANSIVWARRRVWTTSADGASLVPLVGDTHEREPRVRLASYGSSVAARSGSLWVASEKARTVTPVDLDTRRPDEPIALAGGRPLVVAADRDTGIWVGVRVSSKDRAQVPSVVQIKPDRTVRPYLLNHTVQHLAAGLGAVWVIYKNKSFMTRIDAAGNKKHITLDSTDPQRVAVGAGYVWVSNGSDGTVTRIRPPGRLKWNIRLPGSYLRGIAVGGGAVWVADTTQSRLIRINPANRKIVEPPIAVEDPIAVTAHGRNAWVTTKGGSVVRVDPP